MSRQQLLFKLLEKAERGNQFIYSQLYQMTQSSSPPATIKRMQILQMGSCKISGPNMKNNQQPIYEKQNSVNNRRILVLQKVRNYTKVKEIDKKNADQLNFTKRIKNQIISSSVTQSVQQKINQTSPTQAQSPIRYGFTTKKTLSLSQSTRSNRVKKQVQPQLNNNMKSSKNCIFKSIQFQYESARTQNEQALKRRLSNKSRIRKQSQSSFSHNREEDKKSKILIKKQINKNYQKQISPPPKLSAKSYVVYQILQTNQKEQKQNIKVHIAFNSKIRSEIASLTKIMTCILAIQICEKLNLNSNTQEIKIGKFQSSIGGTTANIQIDDVYTLYDLLHGLMLPSGNDASLAIAVWGGKKLIQQKQKSNGQLIHRKKMKKQCYDRFVQQMNAKAQSLGLTKTNYANSHGLVNILNKSCSHDVAILSHYCMKNVIFAKIVSCKQYKTKIRIQTKVKIQNKQEIKINKKKQEHKITFDQQHQYSDLDSQTCSQTSHGELQTNLKEKSLERQIVQHKIITAYREVCWENTHKLLHKNCQQYLGIKTGITTSAGPCLSSCVITPCGRKLFIVVLNCKKLQMRFKQTQTLKKWVYKKQGILKKNSNMKQTKSQVQLSDKQQCDEMDYPQNPNQIVYD